MPAGGGQYIKLSMIVFSNHSMVLFGAWLLPDTCHRQTDNYWSGLASKLNGLLCWPTVRSRPLLLSGLTGGCIKKQTPPLGFVLLLPKQK